jgi:hypothetical protein
MYLRFPITLLIPLALSLAPVYALKLASNKATIKADETCVSIASRYTRWLKTTPEKLVEWNPFL